MPFKTNFAYVQSASILAVPVCRRVTCFSARLVCLWKNSLGPRSSHLHSRQHSAARQGRILRWSWHCGDHPAVLKWVAMKEYFQTSCTGSDCIFSVSIPSNSIAWAHPGYTPIVCASVRYIQSPQDLYPTTSSLAMLWHAACFISHALVVVVIEPNISRHLNCHGDSWSMCRKLPQHIFLESSCFPRCISQSFHCPNVPCPSMCQEPGLLRQYFRGWLSWHKTPTVPHKIS